jgi:hypothetical protein
MLLPRNQMTHSTNVVTIHHEVGAANPINKGFIATPREIEKEHH